MTQLTLFESQIISSCFIHFIVKTSLKKVKEADLHSNTNVQQFYFSELKLQFQQWFWILMQVKKTFSHLNPLHCAIEAFPPNFQLEMINLQCNGILKGNIKRIYRIPIKLYNCLTSNKYAQVKPYARWIDVSGSILSG